VFATPLTLNPNTKYRIASQCDAMSYQSISPTSSLDIAIVEGVYSRTYYSFQFPNGAVGGPPLVGPNIDYEVLPEPSTYALLILGGGVLIWARRRQLRR
jgi:hypothetical protein